MYLENLPYQIPDPSINNQFNFAQANEFYVVAIKIPGVAFYTQSFPIPGVSMDGTVKQPTPFTDISLTGTKLNFEPLTLEFIVNENLENYLSILHWMNGISFPENNDQFINMIREGKITAKTKHVENALTSQIDVIPLDSKHNPINVFSFLNAFPIALGSLQWSTTGTDVEYLKASVTLEYTLFKVQD
jgi:hypothetical protein